VKRGGPLKRTELVRKTPLRASGRPREQSQPRGAPVKARRDTPRRRVAPRWTRQDWKEAMDVLLVRCRRVMGGKEQACCEHCGMPLVGSGVRHHRQKREVGGDRLANIILLTPEHHVWVHEHPEAAKEAGWIVPDSTDPATWPMRLHGRDPVLLDDEGGWSPTA
jgi:hypothetical protein